MNQKKKLDIEICTVYNTGNVAYKKESSSMKVTVSASVQNKQISLSIKSEQDLDQIYEPLLATLTQEKLPHYLGVAPTVKPNEMLIKLQESHSNFKANSNAFNFIKLSLEFGGDVQLTKDDINSPAKKIYDEYTEHKSSGTYTSLEPSFPSGDEKRRFFELELDIDKTTLLKTLKIYAQEIKKLVSMLQTKDTCLIRTPISMKLMINAGKVGLMLYPSVDKMDSCTKTIANALNTKKIPYTLVSYDSCNSTLSSSRKNVPSVRCSVSNSTVTLNFKYGDYTGKQYLRENNILLLKTLVKQLTSQDNDNIDADNDTKELDLSSFLNTNKHCQATLVDENRLPGNEVKNMVGHFLDFIEKTVEVNNLTLSKNQYQIIPKNHPSQQISLGFLTIGDQSAGDAGTCRSTSNSYSTN